MALWKIPPNPIPSLKILLIFMIVLFVLSDPLFVTSYTCSVTSVVFAFLLLYHKKPSSQDPNSTPSLDSKLMIRLKMEENHPRCNQIMFLSSLSWELCFCLFVLVFLSLENTNLWSYLLLLADFLCINGYLRSVKPTRKRRLVCLFIRAEWNLRED